MPFTLNSGIRIFDIIEILLSNPKSREEICLKLKERGIEADKKTITKYLRTLRAAGFEILSDNEIFQIYKSPFKTELTEDEIRGFCAMGSVFQYLFKGKTGEEASFMEEKILSLFKYPERDFIKIGNEEPLYEIKEEESHIIKALNGYINRGSVMVKIKHKSKWLVVIPKELKYKRNGVFLNCFNKKEKSRVILRTSDISRVKYLKEQKDSMFEAFGETVFKITGRLKKNYILKKGERAKYTENEIYVTNIFEDKNELFNRLIKYGKYCEIISPEEDRKKFIRKIKSLIRHYNSM